MFRSTFTFTILGLVLFTANPDTVNAQSSAVTHQPIRQYELALLEHGLVVDGLRAENVNYNPQLLEPLLALAELQEETEDYQGAVASLSEALYISRANFGLFDEAQVEILDSLIAIQQREQNWEEVDALYNAMEQIYLKSSISGKEFANAGLDKVVAWHLYAFREELDKRSLDHIEKAGSIMGRQLALAESIGAGEEKTSYLAGGIAAIDMFLQWNEIEQRKNLSSSPMTMPVQPYEHE